MASCVETAMMHETPSLLIFCTNDNHVMEQSKDKIQTGDRLSLNSTHPITLILDNLRSAYNVGNIFRLAEVCRVESIITCGYTASPPHPKLRKTARGCDECVSFTRLESSFDAAKKIKQNGYQVIAVDTFENGENIWDVEFKFPVGFVFGNEANGISKNTLEYCDIYAKIPVFGYKNSMNVSNCAAVVVYTAIQNLLKNKA